MSRLLSSTTSTSAANIVMTKSGGGGFGADYLAAIGTHYVGRACCCTACFYGLFGSINVITAGSVLNIENVRLTVALGNCICSACDYLNGKLLNAVYACEIAIFGAVYN